MGKFLKLIAILLVATQLNGATAEASTPNNVLPDFRVIETGDPNVTVTDVALTKEQTINRISELEQISYLDAAKKLYESDNEVGSTAFASMKEIINPLAAPTYTSRELKSIHDFGGNRKVEAGAVYRIEWYGSFGSIHSILSKWTTAYSGDHKFTELYNNAGISSNGNEISLNTRGTAEIEVTNGTSTEVTAGLEGNGFAIGNVVGTTKYYRKTVTWNGTAKVHPTYPY
ncbi:MAG: hypothetical protein ACRCTZ_21475 [Sarcina sp.]